MDVQSISKTPKYPDGDLQVPYYTQFKETVSCKSNPKLSVHTRFGVIVQLSSSSLFYLLQHPLPVQLNITMTFVVLVRLEQSLPYKPVLWDQVRSKPNSKSFISNILEKGGG